MVSRPPCLNTNIGEGFLTAVTTNIWCYPLSPLEHYGGLDGHRLITHVSDTGPIQPGLWHLARYAELYILCVNFDNDRKIGTLTHDYGKGYNRQAHICLWRGQFPQRVILRAGNGTTQTPATSGWFRENMLTSVKKHATFVRVFIPLWNCDHNLRMFIWIKYCVHLKRSISDAWDSKIMTRSILNYGQPQSFTQKRST